MPKKNKNKKNKDKKAARKAETQQINTQKYLEEQYKKIYQITINIGENAERSPEIIQTTDKQIQTVRNNLLAKENLPEEARESLLFECDIANCLNIITNPATSLVDMQRAYNALNTQYESLSPSAQKNCTESYQPHLACYIATKFLINQSKQDIFTEISQLETFTSYKNQRIISHLTSGHTIPKTKSGSFLITLYCFLDCLEAAKGMFRAYHLNETASDILDIKYQSLTAIIDKLNSSSETTLTEEDKLFSTSFLLTHCFAIADALFQDIEERNKSTQIFEFVLKITDDPSELVRANIMLIHCYCSISQNYDAGLEACNRALANIQAYEKEYQKKPASLLVSSIIDIAYENQHNNPKLAFICYKKAFDICKEYNLEAPETSLPLLIHNDKYLDHILALARELQFEEALHYCDQYVMLIPSDNNQATQNLNNIKTIIQDIKKRTQILFADDESSITKEIFIETCVMEYNEAINNKLDSDMILPSLLNFLALTPFVRTLDIFSKRVNSYYLLGKIAYKNTDYDQCIKYLSRAMEELSLKASYGYKEPTDNVMIARISSYKALCTSYFPLPDTQKKQYCLTYAQKAVEFFERSPEAAYNPDELKKAYLLEGHFHEQQFEFLDAFACYEKGGTPIAPENQELYLLKAAKTRVKAYNASKDASTKNSILEDIASIASDALSLTAPENKHDVPSLKKQRHYRLLGRTLRKQGLDENLRKVGKLCDTRCFAIHYLGLSIEQHIKDQNEQAANHDRSFQKILLVSAQADTTPATAAPGI